MITLDCRSIYDHWSRPGKPIHAPQEVFRQPRRAKWFVGISSVVHAKAVAACGLPADNVLAQTAIGYPPPPATKLEILEPNPDTIIIKGAAPIGPMFVHARVVDVTRKEDTDAGTGRKEYGIAIDMGANTQQTNRTAIDDELNGLLNASGYLRKIDWSVTSLSGFTAAFTSRGGFRIAAFSSKGRAPLSSVCGTLASAGACC